MVSAPYSVTMTGLCGYFSRQLTRSLTIACRTIPKSPVSLYQLYENKKVVVSIGTIHKLRYTIEVGGWSAKYNH